MTDRENLSPNALKIFEIMKPYFPPDPWDNPQWIRVGRVYENGWYDLRKSSDRKRLEEHLQSAIGYGMKIDASTYKKTRGSLTGFAHLPFSQTILRNTELLLLLDDLDFQIETLDLVES